MALPLSENTAALRRVDALTAMAPVYRGEVEVGAGALAPLPLGVAT